MDYAVHMRTHSQQSTQDHPIHAFILARITIPSTYAFSHNCHTVNTSPVFAKAASVTQDNITSETRAYCGLPAQSDTVRICVDMEARENPVTSLLLGLQRIALSDPATYQQDMYVGDPDWMPIGYYLFAGPVPVSIGCMMINCVPVTSVKMCCGTCGSGRGG